MNSIISRFAQIGMLYLEDKQGGQIIREQDHPSVSTIRKDK